MEDSTETLRTGPYIPQEHAEYDLLHNARAGGWEVFSYPSELSDMCDLLSARFDAKTRARIGADLLIPYGEKSYAEYYAKLDECVGRLREISPILGSILAQIAEITKRMNIKEEWSVMRYVGPEFDDDPMPSLIKGRCYYWPCSKERPVYEGIIDEEEFTSYLYPCNPASWEIMTDPTGTAARALAGEAGTVPFWKIDLPIE